MMPSSDHPLPIRGTIVKPDLDTLEYKVVVLANGLKAILVHDAEADKAAASLDVRCCGSRCRVWRGSYQELL